MPSGSSEYDFDCKMNGFTGSFRLTWRALWRGRTAWFLIAVAVIALVLFPDAARSDGSVAGARELYLKLSVGPVFAAAFIGILSIACGLVADVREQGLLSLERLRPASMMTILLGRWFALVALAAIVLAVSGMVLFEVRDAPRCRYHHEPKLPPITTIAETQLKGYLADPKTPEAIRRAPKAAVLTLLSNKERERYETVPPGETVTWTFDGQGETIAVRFATLADNRATVSGIFRCGMAMVAITNRVSTGLEVAFGVRGKTVSFTNKGKESLLFRPRCDVTLLETADSFAANWARAFVGMLGVIALVAAFGIFLSCGLSRPVATFVAFTFLAAALIAPAAIQQFPDEFHASVSERIGLWLSRQISLLTEAVSDFSPVGDLATGRAISAVALVRTVFMDCLLWPLAFLASGAILVRRKTGLA